MTIAIYDMNKDLVSQGTMNNPLRSYHDGKNGSTYIQLLYIRNDDSLAYFNGIEIIPIDNAGYDDTVGEYGTGFSVKLLQSPTEPLPHEWEQVNAGDKVSIVGPVRSTTIADTTTYVPVWLRIHVPGNVEAQVKADIALRLKYIRQAVGL